MPSPYSKTNPSKIFISYRRSESAAHAGRLSDQLTTYFGSQITFIDNESIEPGRDFVEAIEDAVSSCEVLLAVVGQQWLTCANERGRRLDDPKDFVRVEIAAALKRGIRVIPVLVQGTTMPREQDLPDEIAQLARRQAWEVSDLRWKQDVAKLTEKIGGDIRPQRKVVRRIRYALYVVIATIISLLALSQTPSDQSDVIKVGVSAAHSEQADPFGQSTVNGIKLAADEINQAGGLGGRQIKVYVEGHQNDSRQAVNVVTRLIYQTGVQALLGEVSLANVLAAAPAAQEAKVPMIVPVTGQSATEAGEYIFRNCFTDRLQGEIMAKFAHRSLRAKTAAVMFDWGSDYSVDAMRAFAEHFTGGGGTIVARESFKEFDSDFSDQLTSIRAKNPDVIFVACLFPEAGLIARQAKELGIGKPLLGGDGWDSPQLFEIGGKALNGAYIAAHYSIDDPAPMARNFAAAYRDRFKMEPDALAALGYDSMRVLADAIKRAGTTEGQKLRDAIAQTENFPGVTGSITINSRRNAIKPAVVLELQNPKFIYKEAVWPEGN